MESENNRKQMQSIGFQEGDPYNEREVMFRFCAREEGALYRLASELQKLEYELKVERCSHRATWICVAGRQFAPASESLNDLCLQMLDLAEQYGVVFDSWRTDSPEL